jgi:hypothetical protein
MKKQLLGTTTLVAAGLLMGQGAYAAEPMTASFGGYLTSVFHYADRGDTSLGVGADPREHDFWESGEVQFSASGELDNGIAVGVRIEYEAANQGGGATILDERYVTFSGGFGTLRIGSDDPAANAMHYQSPTPGTAWWIGVSSASGAVLTGAGTTGQVANAASSFVGIYPGVSGDAQKIIYFTPRMSGFQLGASYSPDGGVQEGALGGGTIGNAAAAQSNEISAAVNYQGEFDAVSVNASAGFASARLETFTANAQDRDNWGIGLNFGIDAFAVGASFRHDDRGAINGDADHFEAGATYSAGPWAVGLNYGNVQRETGAATEDDLEVIGVSTSYSMGPGVDFIGALKHYDYGTDTAGTATPDGIVMALGSVVYF